MVITGWETGISRLGDRKLQAGMLKIADSKTDVILGPGSILSDGWKVFRWIIVTESGKYGVIYDATVEEG